MKKIILSISLVLIFSSTAMAGSTPMRFGVLPVLDTLPLQAAARDGLFEKHGLDVELVKFMSALERDTAMQAGQIDGYFGDLVATYLLISRNVPMRIALTSWRTTPGYPMFGFALSPENRNKDLAGVKGGKFGLSRSTVMEFLADKMTDSLGVERGHFEQVEIKKLPIRLQMLLTNQIDCALLPEPLLSLARLKGGATLATAENLDIPLTVLCLHEKYFANSGRDYLRFVAAYEEAVARIRENPEAYRSLMAETGRIPKPLVADFPIYPYPMADLPSAAELAEVQDWMLAKGLLKTRVPDTVALSPIAP
ncbi:MAG: ABC transporter substrate-binding protein [Desulfovibrionaceae bacterium]|nr:ABC transporter substrate-binding protein [Desulfovibrionaceae bacterium]